MGRPEGRDLSGDLGNKRGRVPEGTPELNTTSSDCSAIPSFHMETQAQTAHLHYSDRPFSLTGPVDSLS